MQFKLRHFTIDQRAIEKETGLAQIGRMKPRRWITTLRWICVLPAAGLSFIASVFLSEPVDQCIYWLFLHCGLVSPSKGYFQFSLPWNGAMAAFLFVIVGASVAPSHRRGSSLALLTLGALLALDFIEGLNFPSEHLYPDKGKLEMGWPIAGTLVGGALGVACIFSLYRKTSSIERFA